MPSRAARALWLTLLATSTCGISACGVPGADGDRARVLADTCASTIARAGLPAPTADQIAPERFEEERRRLLDSDRRFNTVTPYRNVCSAIRDALRSEASDAGASGAPADGLDTADGP